MNDRAAGQLPSVSHAQGSGSSPALLRSALGALGIVFGDIGTSPLYTLRECFVPPFAEGASTTEVYGVLSLVFWSLTLVVSIKYLTFVMRADNHGEGGIFALLAILRDDMRPERRHGSSMVSILVVVGAALLYGDGAITPAISVLSAIEGVTVSHPAMTPAVVPVTCLVLVALFVLQRKGTGRIGVLFGPIMVLWFVTIGTLGVVAVCHHPAVLTALSPHHAVRYFHVHGLRGVLVLGSVVLAVTGGEALYADMGHFGARPIRVAWAVLVCPALVASYFGQGALLLANPASVENPFFAMVPAGAASLALVALSTAATIIASQSLISGVFSLTRQAMQLGYFPRVTVRHTAADTEGQIYIPQLNWILAVACVLLVVGFQRSQRLASAYGIAVTGTMLLTSIVYFIVLRRAWHWRLALAVPVLVLFLCVDLPFFAANSVKILDGGWVPVTIGFVFFAAMLVWHKGRSLVAAAFAQRSHAIEEGLRALLEGKVARVPGTSVFLSSNRERVPPILTHLVQRGCSVHATVFLVTVVTEPIPRVPEEQRLEHRKLADGFHGVVLHHGFMESSNVPRLVALAAERAAVPFDAKEVTYFLGRERLLALQTASMGRIAEGFFSFLARNQVSVDAHFQIPPGQVVEIGIQLDL